MTDKPRKSFGSDNHAGIHPAVIQALTEANTGEAVAYGADSWTERATGELKRLFGTDGEAYLVFNGGGANVLGLGLLLDRHEAVICADSAHINTDECGSPERMLGTKLLPVPAPDGKLTPDLIETRLAGRGDQHFAQAGVVSLTQSTECGTCYSLPELAKIRDFCRANSLRVFMDGARLANAAAHLGCTLADLASHADVLTFGGTKNGAMGVEAVIVMSPEYQANALYLRKQQMQLSSKMRFLAAQFLALLDDDLWLRNATHANAMATRLATGLSDVPGVQIRYPVEADAVFARLDPRHIAELRREWTFHVWDEANSIVRWMTAFDMRESDVDSFVASIASVAGTLS
ncbi:MAG: aminotransferase class I/II-fold pyridoxal phosphate-dependent enzyme [Nocardiopsaceae bacterium]|nr:aminotransferase class I/II-fold pyridoxal phosphate-dependent enzyme [Nocardiopsaceae bacterium]